MGVKKAEKEVATINAGVDNFEEQVRNLQKIQQTEGGLDAASEDLFNLTIKLD